MKDGLNHLQPVMSDLRPDFINWSLNFFPNGLELQKDGSILLKHLWYSPYQTDDLSVLWVLSSPFSPTSLLCHYRPDEEVFSDDRQQA